jgi:topoisomerase-4 subunit A
LKKLQFDEDFAAIAIKGRGSMGNIVTKYPVKKILLKTKGISTLSGRKIWYDEILKRLNVDGRGKYLGEFDGDDRILTVLSNGIYQLTSFDLNNHFDDKMVLIEKYNPEKVYSVVHYDGKSKNYMVKRFMFENIAIGKQTSLISEESGSKMLLISGAAQPIVKVDQLKGATKTPETVELNLADLIDVKGTKAMGNRLSAHVVQRVTLLAEHDDAEDVPDPEPDTVEETQIIVTPEDKTIADLAPPANSEVNTDLAPVDYEPSGETAVEVDEPSQPPVEPAPASEESENPSEKSTEKSVKSSGKAEKAPVESSDKSEQSPAKKIDFEITNPDDVDIDDKGQLGLF